MKPDPHSVLSWLRGLASAKLVELTPRTLLDVEALLRLDHLAEDPATLAAALASLLAHDEVSWRQIEESFVRWRGHEVRPESAVSEEGSATVSQRRIVPNPSACARTLGARGEHGAPLREEPLPSIEQLDTALRCWAACACVVPDPIWPQLDAIRRALPELLAELPDARYVHRLIEWLQRHGAALDPNDPRVPTRAARLGQADRLVLSKGQRQQLGAWLRKRDRQRRGPGPGLGEQARRLILEQLRAADVEGDPFEAKKRALKIDLHEAVLDPNKARALLGKWGHTAVAGELRAFMEDERGVQRLDQSGTRWSSGVWDAFEAWAGDGDGETREWARPMDVLRPRPWTPERRRVVLAAMIAVVGSYAGWWMFGRGQAEVDRRTIVRGEVVRVPATWEVKRPAELSDEDAALRRPCEDVVSLAGVAPMKLKCVVGGVFLMGSPETEAGHDEDESPQHTAKVASFDMGEKEVTQGQWKAVMGTEPFDCSYGCGDDYPAHNVSWNDAVDFMNRLTEKENAVHADGSQMTACYKKYGDSWAWTNKDCTGYRLPTETEWEYAARAGTTTAYSFGDDAGALGEHAWYRENSEIDAHPVRTKQPNPKGLYDMHGNVWEWVWDWYGPYGGDTEAAYGGPESGEYRVLRGGSFWGDPRDLRSALRNWDRPTDSSGDFGFRCVRVL